MSYSTEKESNSLGLSMFASVGFHAILFVAMAFIPAASETVKKPLRIVNLLPPQSSSSGDGTNSQVKTSTLEDILRNPLPDLSAGVPPLGNTTEPTPEAEPNASSYVGDGTGLNSRVDTSALDWTNPPTQSFSGKSSQQDQSSSAPALPSVPNSTGTSTPSSPIEPAPNTSSPTAGVDLPPPIQDLPPLTGAVSTPINPGGFPTFPGSNNGAGNPTLTSPPVAPGALNPDVPNPEAIPPSQQRVIPIISEVVAYNYPQEACRDQLQGTATLSYYRQPDGTYVDGSGTFENSAGHPALDDAALAAVINYPASGIGNYQRYSSRFDFVYDDQVCASSTATIEPGSGADLIPIPDLNNGSGAPPDPGSQSPEQPDVEQEEAESGKKKKKKKSKKKEQPEAPEFQPEEKTSSDPPIEEIEPSAPAPAQIAPEAAPATAPEPPALPEPPQPVGAPEPPPSPEGSGSASDLEPPQPLPSAAPEPEPVAPPAPPPELELSLPENPPAPAQPPGTISIPDAFEAAPSSQGEEN